MTRWVFLRGWAREARHWGAFPDDFRALHPEAEITLLDLPGAGARNAEPCPASVEGIVESCRTHLGATPGGEPLHLLGLSLGGMACLQWAASHPREVAAAVVINSSAGRCSPRVLRLRPRNYPALARALLTRDAQAREALVLALTSRDAGEHSGVAQAWAAYARERPMRRRAALAQLLAASRFRLPDTRLAVPALVLASDGDGLVDPRCSRAMARALDADIAIHPTAGHDLTLDDGLWVAAQARRWITRT